MVVEVRRRKGKEEGERKLSLPLLSFLVAQSNQPQHKYYLLCVFVFVPLDPESVSLVTPTITQSGLLSC